MHFLSSCLPQSENTSEEAGEGEYVSLYSSGQSSEELAHSRGVSNLRAASCMRPGLAGLGHASAWLSLPGTRRLGPCGLAESQHGSVERVRGSWRSPPSALSACGIPQARPEESSGNLRRQHGVGLATYRLLSRISFYPVFQC